MKELNRTSQYITIINYLFFTPNHKIIEYTLITLVNYFTAVSYDLFQTQTPPSTAISHKQSQILGILCADFQPRDYEIFDNGYTV